jgi:hypothetical protein
MTTSGVTAWSLTALDIVKAAMGELATIEPGTEPDAEEFEDCVLRLNGMLKSWQLQGVSLMREATDTFTTTPATALVDFGDVTDVRSIISVRLVESATNERQLWPWSRHDYFAIPNKAATGSPTAYFFQRERDELKLYLWPVSATAKDIIVDYDRIVETVTANGQTLDIREELHETVYSNLAVRIAGIFGQTPGPELVERARILETQMFDAERPDSYRFETDYSYA